jgi:hypothetical protein
MKRLFFAFTMLALLITGSAFATDNVTPSILRSFENTFSNASEVSWSTIDNFTVARFTQDTKVYYAYYNRSSELTLVAECISPEQLNKTQQRNLKKEYGDYLVSDVYKVEDEDGTRYFAVVESSSTKIILRSIGNSWDVLRKSTR